MMHSSYRSFLLISFTYISVMVTAAFFEWNYLTSITMPETTNDKALVLKRKLGMVTSNHPVDGGAYTDSDRATIDSRDATR